MMWQVVLRIALIAGLCTTPIVALAQTNAQGAAVDGAPGDI
ncbi:MAG: hypothetical protein RLZZ491_1408, partial [Pseudomonadota bacterium]